MEIKEGEALYSDGAARRSIVVFVFDPIAYSIPCTYSSVLRYVSADNVVSLC